MSIPMQITDLLHTQQNQLNNLVLLLKDEYNVLQQHNPTKLIEITQLKNELLAKIDETDQMFTLDKQFVQDKEQGKYVDELKTIETTLMTCKELNQVNGDVINKSQLSIERMRTSLLESNTKSSLTYDNKGKTNGGLSSLDLKA